MFYQGTIKEFSNIHFLGMQQLERDPVQHRNSFPLSQGRNGVHRDKVFVLEPFTNCSFGGTIRLMLQVRKHELGKEGSSRHGIPSKFPGLCEGDNQMRPAREKWWWAAHSLSVDPMN